MLFFFHQTFQNHPISCGWGRGINCNNRYMNERCVTDGFDAAVGKETSDEDLVDVIKMIHGELIKIAVRTKDCICVSAFQNWDNVPTLVLAEKSPSTVKSNTTSIFFMRSPLFTVCVQNHGLSPYERELRTSAHLTRYLAVRTLQAKLYCSRLISVPLKYRTASFLILPRRLGDFFRTNG